MKKGIFCSVGLLWLRVLVGVGIAHHGYGKVFGGIDGVIGMTTSIGFPFPVFFAWAAALTEFAGGLCIAAGLLTRVTAGFLLINMSVAAFIVHKGAALSVRELALAYWVIAGTLILTGPGRFSLDRLIFPHRCK